VDGVLSDPRESTLGLGGGSPGGQSDYHCGSTEISPDSRLIDKLSIFGGQDDFWWLR